MSIQNKKTNFRNIIKKTAASASVLALLAGGATEALGTTVVNAADATLENGVQKGTDIKHVANNAVHIKTGGDVHWNPGGTAAVAKEVFIGAATKWTIEGDATAGAAAVINGAPRAAVQVFDGQTFTITGKTNGANIGGVTVAADDISGYGDFTLGNKGGGGATFQIKLSAAGVAKDYLGTIDGDAKGKGILDVQQGNITFKEEIGAAKSLEAIIAADDLIFEKNVSATDISIAATTSLTFNVANNNITVTGDKIDGVANGDGDIIATGGNNNRTVTINSEVGKTNAIRRITVDDDTNLTFTNSVATKAAANSSVALIGNKSVLTFDANGADRTVQNKGGAVKNIDAANAGNGTVAFKDSNDTGNKTITLTKVGIGAFKTIQSITIDNVSVDVSEAIKTQNGANVGELKLGDKGRLVVSNAAATIDADIQINGTAAKIDTKAALNPSAAGSKITVSGVGEITSTGGTVSIGNVANTFDSIDFTNANSELTVIGVNNNDIIKATEMNFKADGAHLILGKGKSNFDLKIDAAINQNHANGKITWNPGAVNNLTFTQKIGDTGDAAKRLDELRVTIGGVIFEADAHIKNVALDGDGTLTLSQNIVVLGSNYRFGSVAVKTNNTNTIKLANVTTLVSNDEEVNIGSDEFRFKEFDFATKALTVGDQINIYATTAVSTGGAADLKFGGNSIFSAKVDTKTIAKIAVNGPVGSVVQFTEDLDADGDVSFANAGAIVQFAGNEVKSTVGGTIGNGGASTGIVRFARTAGNQTVAYNVGGKISDVQFIGRDVEFTKAFAAGGINFTENTKNNVAVTFEATTDLGAPGAVVVQNNSNFTGTLIVAAKQKYGANFEVKGSKNTIFTMTADKTFDIQSAKMSKAVITSKTSDQVTVDMNVDGAVLDAVGASTSSRVKELNFKQNGTVNNGTWAKTVNIDAGQVATLGGKVHSEGVILAGAGAVTNFNSGATLDAPMTTTADKTGVANFAGSATLDNNIGTETLRFSEINFAASADDKHVVELNNTGMHATNLSFGSGTFNLHKDLTLNGTSALNSTNFNVAKSTLSSTGGGIVAKDDIKLSVDVAADSHGSIKIASGSTLDVDNLKSLKINVDQDKTIDIHGNNSFDLVDASAAKITGGDQLAALVASGVPVTVNGGTTFVSWAVTLSDDNKIVLSQFSQIKPVLINLGLNDGISSDLANPANARFVQEIQNEIFADKNASQDLKNAKVKEKVERIDDQNQEGVNQEVEQSHLAASDQMNARMRNSDAMPVMSVASADSEGVAAGDVHDQQYKNGVWLSPFYRSAEQKQRKGVSGYDSTVSGVTFGVDTMVNNDLKLGAGFTYAHSDLKHQNVRKGDKTKVDSYLFSLYAMQYVTNNAFVQGIATIGANSIKSNSQRVLGISTYQVARAKYNSMSFSLEGMTGYNYVIEDFVLTPMVGLRFMRVNDGGYTETGTTNQNLKVSRKAAHRFDIIAGGRVAAPRFMVADMNVTPEAHAFVTHDFVGKNPQTDVRLDYSTVPFSKKAKNPAKTSYNLGLSANAEQGMMEYSLGYDFQAAEDFHAHQGTFKVRVKF